MTPLIKKHNTILHAFTCNVAKKDGRNTEMLRPHRLDAGASSRLVYLFALAAEADPELTARRFFTVLLETIVPEQDWRECLSEISEARMARAQRALFRPEPSAKAPHTKV